MRKEVLARNAGKISFVSGAVAKGLRFASGAKAVTGAVSRCTAVQKLLACTPARMHTRNARDRFGVHGGHPRKFQHGGRRCTFRQA